MAFEAYHSEPPLPGQVVNAAMARLMSPAPPEPVMAKGVGEGIQGGLRRGRRPGGGDPGDGDAAALLDEEEDEAATSTHERRNSDDDDDDDDDEVDNEGDAQQEAEDEEITEEELGRPKAETPRPQPKKLCTGHREDTPSGRSSREFRGNPSKSPGFEIPMVVLPSSWKRNIRVKTL